MTPKLGTFEFFMLVTAFLLGTASLLIPVSGLGEQDMWISGLIGWFVGLIIVFILCFFNTELNTPSRVIIGLFALHLAALVTRNIGELLKILMLPQTPLILISSILVFCAAYTTWHGIEVLSRITVQLLTLAIISYIIILYVTVRIINVENIHPILDHEIKLLIYDAIPFMAFPFMETVVFLALITGVNKPCRALLGGAFLAGGLMVVSMVIFVITLPPTQIQNYILPLYMAVDKADQANILQLVLVLIWLNTGFIKLAVLHYIATVQIAQTIKVDHRPFIVPISVIIGTLSVTMYTNVIEMFTFAVATFPYYATVVYLGVLISLSIKRWLK